MQIFNTIVTCCSHIMIYWGINKIIINYDNVTIIANIVIVKIIIIILLIRIL